MNKSHIYEEYKRMGKNFMTPNVKKYEAIDNRIIELSTGFGFDNKLIIGVSEFEYDSGKLESTGRGEIFYTLKEANRYYKQLLNS